MNIAIITTSPKLIRHYFKSTVLNQAILNKSIKLHIIDIRDYAVGQYKQIDDTPYGGGAGMVLMPEPLIKAIKEAFTLLESHKNETRVIYPSPQGEKWNQESALEHIAISNIIFICGRYKGIDQRIIHSYVTHEYSLGDYIISNGELSSLAMIDSILRFLPGTMNNIDSALSDSFSNNLLDHPHYTKPRVVNGQSVPDVLLNGHHKKIEIWRKNKSEKATKLKRPDLWKKYNKSFK